MLKMYGFTPKHIPRKFDQSKRIAKKAIVRSPIISQPVTPYEPKTEFGRTLLALREKIIASGESKLMSADEISMYLGRYPY